MQEAQTAAPLERLILLEGILSKISGENVAPVKQSQPISIRVRTVVPGDRRETYLAGIQKLIRRYCPNGKGFNAYLDGAIENNNLPIVYYRI